MKNKRFLALFTAVFILFSSVPVAAFVNLSDIVVQLQIDNPIMEVNGSNAEIDAGRGTTPVVVNGRTLVPIRAIIEAFGGEVLWDGETQTVKLVVAGDVIKLGIGNKVAYLNGRAHVLDVAPAIINERTMLPIRFIAEGFNFGVAWNSNTREVTIVRNSFDEAEYNYLLSILPEYSGEPYIYLNNNIPFFKGYEMIDSSFEYYSKLDSVGRCDVCMASIASDMEPDEERGSISSVTPSGWINAYYDEIEGGYLYNRCHLIGYQLTGENANSRNLITGTRYLNIDGMLPFENIVADYIEKTGNRVMYRVTPVFKGNNLVADGVLMEAYSFEDGGVGVSFCVYCYNVQPGITIDYATGNSRGSNATIENVPGYEESFCVYRTPSGKKYHFDAECGGKSSFEVTLEAAKSAGLTPCAKCVK